MMCSENTVKMKNRSVSIKNIMYTKANKLIWFTLTVLEITQHH